MNGESESVGMKGEDVKQWRTEGKQGNHQEKLDKQSTCENIYTWVEFHWRCQTFYEGVQRGNRLEIELEDKGVCASI